MWGEGVTYSVAVVTFGVKVGTCLVRAVMYICKAAHM